MLVIENMITNKSFTKNDFSFILLSSLFSSIFVNDKIKSITNKLKLSSINPNPFKDR